MALWLPMSLVRKLVEPLFADETLTLEILIIETLSLTHSLTLSLSLSLSLS